VVSPFIGSGLWMVASVEEQAYQLDGRYTKDPTAVFSVATKSRNGSAPENTEPAPFPPGASPTFLHILNGSR
jgi:hypothetical protein